MTDGYRVKKTLSEIGLTAKESSREWLKENHPHGARKFQGNQYEGGEVPNENLTRMPATPKESTRAPTLATPSVLSIIDITDNTFDPGHRIPAQDQRFYQLLIKPFENKTDHPAQDQRFCQ